MTPTRQFSGEQCFLGSSGVLLASLLNSTGPQAKERPELAKLRQQMRPQAHLADGIWSLEIRGFLTRNPSPWDLMMGAEDIGSAESLVAGAIRNQEVRGLLLSWDVPGSSLQGVPELADVISKSDKPIVSWVGGHCSGGAYWCAAQSDYLVASKSALVGGIGTFTMVVDESKAYHQAGIGIEILRNKEGDLKAIGVPGTSIDDIQRQHLMEQVEASYAEFAAAVTSRRQIAPAGMRGQDLSGTQAKELGLIDSIGSERFARTILRRLF